MVISNYIHSYDKIKNYVNLTIPPKIVGNLTQPAAPGPPKPVLKKLSSTLQETMYLDVVLHPPHFGKTFLSSLPFVSLHYSTDIS